MRAHEIIELRAPSGTATEPAGWVAVCVCGWQSFRHRSKIDALVDADTHRREIGPKR